MRPARHSRNAGKRSTVPQISTAISRHANRRGGGGFRHAPRQLLVVSRVVAAVPTAFPTATRNQRCKFASCSDRPSHRSESNARSVILGTARAGVSTSTTGARFASTGRAPVTPVRAGTVRLGRRRNSGDESMRVGLVLQRKAGPLASPAGWGRGGPQGPSRLFAGHVQFCTDVENHDA
jgi:hypothetical protein